MHQITIKMQTNNFSEGLTLETLPKAFFQLTIEVSEIKRLLLEKSTEQPTPDRWLNLEQLCEYHPDKPKKPTVYMWISAGAIPVHKSGKRLRFLKSEIDNWLLKGKKKTLAETAIEANNYLASKKKGALNE